MSIQQMLLGAGKPPTKHYIDDVFSMDPFYGTGANKTITTGVNLKDDGGFVWIKTRETTYENLWFSPAMGVNYNITPASAAAVVNQGGRIWQYNTNNFKIGSDQSVNHTNNDVMSWSFKNNKGFFQLVEWTGTGSARTISHELGCKPGFIAVKSMTQGGNWTVWHRGMNKGVTPHNYYQRLNVGGRLQTDYQPFTAEPTSTGFAIIADNSNDYEAYMNKSGETYKAWVWAGGASESATARSVGFSSSSTYLSIPDSNDFDFGSTFTFEAWVKPEFHSGGNNLIFEHGSFQISITDAGRFNFDLNHIHTNGDLYSSAGSVPEGQWTHVAVVGTSGTLKMYINGVNDQSHNRTGVNVTGDTGAANISDLGGYYFKGKISNLRIVKGTAVYTSSFRPPTEPLTNITNTVLLCCNNSSTTGSTVTPGTITANGSPTAETDSPFDDPGNFIFGDSGDQNIIKTGYYIGNGDSTNGLEVELGFEPQFVWIKADGTGADADYNWLVFDSMRRMDNNKTNNTHDSGKLHSSNNIAEVTDDDGINILPTGFKIQGNNDDRNGDGHQYIYIAIRASEGYVSKVPAAGTDVFTMDTGNSSSIIPTFDSGFPVDFLLQREPASGNHWRTSARLIGTNYFNADGADEETSQSNYVWDSSIGALANSSWGSSKQAWLWKRHAGFDVVNYTGTGDNSNSGPNNSSQDVAHNLGKPPEMIWVKCRSIGYNWYVYHKNLNGGTNPHNYYLRLNNTDAEQESVAPYTNAAWNNKAPTSTHFSLGPGNDINDSDQTYMAVLFASVAGISKCGGYSGSSSTVTVDCGFVPRLVIMKKRDAANGWLIFDTVRGIADGADCYMFLDSSAADVCSYDVLDLVDSGGVKGFSVPTTGSNNDNGSTYIYYAHA